LFLADRNILANQAQTDFGGFDEKLCLRITPRTFRENKNVPTAQNIYFTIFSTLMTPEGEPSYKQYDENFFDLIIIDECHRGGANDESRWRDILDYFSSAFQLGLTATPKRTDNVNTYEYFGEPVYQYSLKQGIEDGFLTPFRHVVMKTTIDEYIYSVDDDIIEGEDLIDEDKVYEEKDFYYGNIEIVKRDELRVKEMLNEINPNDKTLVFCYNQSHAAKIRDMINRLSNSKNPNYCVRVTANDGTIGESYLRQFQDNENLIPTILTTSHKLSTGVDARNIRNIVLMRPVNSMIEFKQIIGRGTRIFDNKLYFSILDFVKAYEKYQDPQWDGEPICPRCNQVDCICDGNEPPRVCSKCGQKPCVCKKEPCGICGESPCVCGKEPCRVCGQLPCVCKKKKIVIKLSDKREIEVIKDYMFMDVDGKPISTKEFIEKIFGHLPQYFNSKEELIKIWANPLSREKLLHKLEIAGFGIDKLTSLQEIIDAKESDLLDVLEYIAYSIKPIKRLDRVEENRDSIYSNQQRSFYILCI
jgi:type I restriction enzyme R subunit